MKQRPQGLLLYSHFLSSGWTEIHLEAEIMGCKHSFHISPFLYRSIPISLTLHSLSMKKENEEKGRHRKWKKFLVNWNLDWEPVFMFIMGWTNKCIKVIHSLISWYFIYNDSRVPFLKLYSSPEPSSKALIHLPVKERSWLWLLQVLADTAPATPFTCNPASFASGLRSPSLLCHLIHYSWNFILTIMGFLKSFQCGFVASVLISNMQLVMDGFAYMVASLSECRLLWLNFVCTLPTLGLKHSRV